MMTYPWNAGDVLTAADLNAYAGLILVKTQTVGTAVASVTVSNAFSATFDSYRIILRGITASTQTSMVFTLGNSTTQYYGSYYYDQNLGTDTGTARRSNGANLYIGTLAVTTDNRTSFDCIGPNIADYTGIMGMDMGAGYAGWFAGTHFIQTAYTGFTIKPTSGTVTGGTIKVYGYNNG